jgi:hypothetical protein
VWLKLREVPVRVNRKTSANTQIPFRPIAMSATISGLAILDTVMLATNTTSTPEDCWMYWFVQRDIIV